jgi:lipoprotein-anchoring transpeptidase ErfK/SrfK
MMVYVGGKPLEGTPWDVSTASAAHTDCTYGACRTPIGTFAPTRIARMTHAPAKFKSVPMPNCVYFDNEGDAFHAAIGDEIAELGKKTESHGCVRLHPDHAEAFFDLVAQHERPAGKDRNGYPIFAYPGVSIVIMNGQLLPDHHEAHRKGEWI